jgi:hypothetical protein
MGERGGQGTTPGDGGGATPGEEGGTTPVGGRGARFGLPEGRPLSVYLVLAAGLGVLILLLALVVITSRNDDGPLPPICLPVTLAEAEDAVNAGGVERMHVLTESGNPEVGPLAVTLDLADAAEGNRCRELPKGVAEQDDFFRLIGVVTVYNQTRAGEQRIALVWEEQGDIPRELLATPTNTPAPTATPSPAPTATATPPPTATPTPTATPAPTATATPRPASPTPSPSPPPATPPPVPTPRPTATTAPAATATPVRSTATPTATLRATTPEAQPSPPARPTPTPLTPP